MSHTFLVRQRIPVITVVVTIVDYVVGGETVTAAELLLSSVDSVIFGGCPPSQNSLASLLFPVLEGGKVKLFRFLGGVPTEIPATIGLNAIIGAIVITSG